MDGQKNAAIRSSGPLRGYRVGRFSEAVIALGRPHRVFAMGKSVFLIMGSAPKDVPRIIKTAAKRTNHFLLTFSCCIVSSLKKYQASRAIADRGALAR